MAGTRVPRWLARAAVAAISLAAASCRDCNPASPSSFTEPSREVWVSPNVASRDFLDLFTRSDEWRTARGKVSTIGFFDAQVRHEPCDLCGPNTLDRFLHVVPEGAFRWLRANRLWVAIEAPSVKASDCSAAANAGFAEEAIRNVEDAGGAVRWVAMDEPFTSGLPSCHQTIDETAAAVAGYVRMVNGAFPGTGVGLIEPYPFFSEQQIESFLDALERAGVHLPFFHVDFDSSYPDVDFRTDLNALRAFCWQHGIRFGVIMIGSDGSSSQAAISGALDRATLLSGVLGLRAEDHILFESWLDVPSLRGQQDERLYPDNLPENDPFTMMGLVNTALTLP